MSCATERPAATASNPDVRSAFHASGVVSATSITTRSGDGSRHRRLGKLPMPAIDLLEPGVDCGKRAAIGSEAIESVAKGVPPREERRRHSGDALHFLLEFGKGGAGRHRQERVAQLAAGADQLIAIREVLQDRRRRDAGALRDVPERRSGDPELVVGGNRGFQDGSPSVLDPLGTLAEPVPTLWPIHRTHCSPNHTHSSMAFCVDALPARSTLPGCRALERSIPSS